MEFKLNLFIYWFTYILYDENKCISVLQTLIGIFG